MIFDNKMEFYFNGNLIYSLSFQKSDGILKKNESEIIIISKQNKINLTFEKVDNAEEIDIDTTEVFFNAFKDYLTVRSDLLSLEGQGKNINSKDEKKENTEKVLQLIGILAMFAQFISFLLAKLNLKNSYHEKVIGKIQIGNMIGADTTVSQSTYATNIGVIGAVMMGLCCISFFILAGMSSKIGTGKSMSLFGVFAVITIIGGFIVAIF